MPDRSGPHPAQMNAMLHLDSEQKNQTHRAARGPVPTSAIVRFPLALFGSVFVCFGVVNPTGETVNYLIHSPLSERRYLSYPRAGHFSQPERPLEGGLARIVEV